MTDTTMQRPQKAEVQEIDGMPLRWRDSSGTMHAVEGGYVGVAGISPLLLWPVCGTTDVPANAAWKGRDDVNCKGCQEKMRGDSPDMNSLRFAIAAIAIRALGRATDLSREDIALALEKAADDLRFERLV